MLATHSISFSKLETTSRALERSAAARGQPLVHRCDGEIDQLGTRRSGGSANFPDVLGSRHIETFLACPCGAAAAPVGGPLLWITAEVDIVVKDHLDVP